MQKSYKTYDSLKDHIHRGHGEAKEHTNQVITSINSCLPEGYNVKVEVYKDYLKEEGNMAT